MVDMSQIANALGGFGAGLQGRGLEFAQQQNDQRRQAAADEQNTRLFGAQMREKDQEFEANRQKTQFTDAAAAFSLFNQDNIDGVVNLGRNRKENLTKLGVEDTSTTDQYLSLAEMCQSGNKEACERLGTSLKGSVDLGVSLKILDPPPKAERVGSKDIIEGKGGKFVVKENPDGSFTTTKVLESANVSDSGKASAVTKIYDNGTTVQALPGGKVIVKGPDGVAVEGAERLAVLKSARKEQLTFERTKAGEKASGSQAIERSGKAFDRVEGIKSSILNIDSAIQAIDDGAKSGLIASKLPSVTSASQKLDNLQKKMGLDVIGETTFGALSESELAFAIDTALPLKMDPPTLRKWLVDKKEAQTKLSNYLQDAAIYMGNPGNTVQGWLESQKAIASKVDEQPPAVRGGGQNNVTTQSQFDALPSGALFIEDGKQYRKP